MKITVIGGGNMGGAIARGAIAKGVVAASDVTVSDPSDSVQKSFKQFAPNINLSCNNALAIAEADIIIVAVKPWLMETIIGEIRKAIHSDRQMLVSIAAGVTFEMLEGYLEMSKFPALFRVIPNTAITLGESTTFVSSKGASVEQREVLVGLLSSLGMTFEVPESQMVAVTALASCGIAYAFKYVDAAVKGGEQMGLDADMAQKIVMQTVKGALAMLEANGTEPQTEIDKVTTPGGITLKGLEQMERSGFSQAVIDGLKASK